MRRAAIQRGIGFGMLLLLAWAAIGPGARFVRYACRYDHSRFRPASLETRWPTCYYIDWRERWSDDAQLRDVVDGDGVVRSIRDRTHRGELRHNALRVIQVALAVHDLLLEEPTPARDAFFRRQLEWVAEEGLARLPGGRPVWPHYDEFQRYGLGDVWISALTQGQAISLLVRGARYTGESRYLALAREAAEVLRDPGLPLRWESPRGPCFYEEFPCEPPAHVLNGCLLAWLGLWDLARESDDVAQRQACLRDLECFEPILAQHAIGSWTRYDLHQVRPTSPAYHELHAALAEAIAAISGRAIWRERALLWRQSAVDPRKRWRVAATVLWSKVKGGRSGLPAAPRGIGLSAAGLELRFQEEEMR